MENTSNETRRKVHNLIILDESGSMETIKKPIMQGFNEIVQTMKGIAQQFPDQEHFISAVSFNGLGQKVLHDQDPVEKLEQIDASRYKPDADTPLYDAMGFAIGKLRTALTGQEKCNVLVTILTDGQENASREFTGAHIKKLVEELKSEGWTFTYIGADHDVEQFASTISIYNTMKFEKNDGSISNMWVAESKARVEFSRRIFADEDPSADLYKK
jgi:Mg-chelatase subunit ChlD